METSRQRDEYITTLFHCFDNFSSKLPLQFNLVDLGFLGQRIAELPCFICTFSLYFCYTNAEIIMFYQLVIY